MDVFKENNDPEDMIMIKGSDSDFFPERRMCVRI